MSHTLDPIAGQANISTVNTFFMGVPVPLVAERIWSTKALAEGYIHDTDGSALAGLVLTVTSDSTPSNNGAYLVVTDNTQTNHLKLVRMWGNIDVIEYTESDSGDEVPEGEWSEEIPSINQGKWLWTRYTFTDGTVAYTKAYSGVDGTNGSPGSAGADGDDGISIGSVSWTSNSDDQAQGTPGTTDTYTVYSNETTPQSLGTFTVYNGENGSTGDDGVGVSTAAIDSGTGHLIITLTNGTEIDAGNAKGADGTGVAIKASQADCTQIGDGYIDSNGHLQILTTLPNTFTDAGLIRGPQGNDGATWFNGTLVTSTTSNLPTNCKVGDYYLNTDSYNIWRCISTSTTAGDNRWVLLCNIKGATGSLWFAGTAVTATTSAIPSGLDVRIGDYYLNRFTYDVWKCVSTSTGALINRWQLVCNIKGGDGAPGSTGPSGSDGNSVFIRYSANSDGNPMHTTFTSGDKYIGIYTGASASLSYQDYTWCKFIGDDGTSVGDTWREIYVNDTSKAGTATSTKAINFKSGSNVTVTYEGPGVDPGNSGSNNYFNVKISATNTDTKTGQISLYDSSLSREYPILLKNNPDYASEVNETKFIHDTAETNPAHIESTINSNTGKITTPGYILRNDNGTPNTDKKILLGDGTSLSQPSGSYRFLQWTDDNTGFQWVGITDNDTKNTAGSQKTLNKIYLVGTQSRATSNNNDNEQSYTSNTEVSVTNGVLTAKSFITTSNQYFSSGNSGLNLNNSDIVGANSIFFKDTCENGEGIHFIRVNDGTAYDTIRANGGRVFLDKNWTLGGSSVVNSYDIAVSASNITLSSGSFPSATSTSNRYYPVETDTTTGFAVVNVPWESGGGSGGSSATITIKGGVGGAASTFSDSFALNESSNKTVYIPVFTGAASGQNGDMGLVPRPLSGDYNKFLKGDGTWGVPQDTTYNDYAGSTHGLVPVAPASGVNVKYLRGDGSWEIPSGSGGGGLSSMAAYSYINSSTVTPMHFLSVFFNQVFSDGESNDVSGVVKTRISITDFPEGLDPNEGPSHNGYVPAGAIILMYATYLAELGLTSGRLVLEMIGYGDYSGYIVCNGDYDSYMGIYTGDSNFTTETILNANSIELFTFNWSGYDTTIGSTVGELPWGPVDYDDITAAAVGTYSVVGGTVSVSTTLGAVSPNDYHYNKYVFTFSGISVGNAYASFKTDVYDKIINREYQGAIDKFNDIVKDKSNAVFQSMVVTLEHRSCGIRNNTTNYSFGDFVGTPEV